MTLLAQLNLARADLARHGHLPRTAWAIRQRIARLKAELRQEHKDFMRFLDVQAKTNYGADLIGASNPSVASTMEGVKQGSDVRARVKSKLLRPMSCDDWIGPRRVKYTQNCEINPDL